jgi:hypothetical protein
VSYIYRHRIDADGEPFTDEMADLLTAQRRFDEAAALYRERADAGDLDAVKRLARCSSSRAVSTRPSRC